MDYICYDMPWAKSPIDMALWDIQGKVRAFCTTCINIVPVLSEQEVANICNLLQYYKFYILQLLKLFIVEKKLTIILF